MEAPYQSLSTNNPLQLHDQESWTTRSGDRKGVAYDSLVPMQVNVGTNHNGPHLLYDWMHMWASKRDQRGLVRSRAFKY
jgi:hypothetical protein